MAQNDSGAIAPPRFSQSLGIRMLRRWLFWLPALYLGVLGLAGLDMVFTLSGSGEGNMGAWIVIFSFWPVWMVGQAFGISISNLHPGMYILLIVLQAAGLLFIGMIIDAVFSRKKGTIA